MSFPLALSYNHNPDSKYIVMITRKVVIFIALLMLFAGCARNTEGGWKAPLVYRIDVQQGNVVDQSMINKLRPGMEKNQVKFIMGTPLLIDPFHDDRWEYLYSMEPGSGEREQRHITLYFKDEKLDRIDGDIVISENPVVEDSFAKERTVVVPLDEHQEGFFDKLFGPDQEKEIEDSDSDKVTVIEEAGPDENAPPEPGETIETIEGESTVVVDENETGATEETDQESVAEVIRPKEEKGLLRRFWDRVTSSEEDSTRENPETERDRRDAEVFEKTGGEL